MKNDIFRGILATIVVLTILTLCWSAAYLLTNFLYDSYHIELNEWLRQIINSIFGFVFFITGIFIITQILSKHRKRQIDFFQSITDAMQQIATGDFNVHLSKMKGHDNPNDPFGKIVDNINYMATELGEIEHMRQEFISNVSHEIQSPLTSISGFARALKNEQLTKGERLRYLSIIETESKRLSNISDNLLKLTYLEAEQHNFTLEEFRLDKQLQRVILATEPQWDVKEIEMILQTKETTIIADEALLNQVWFNLLHNAIKFTDDLGTVTVSVEQGEQTTMVRIADTGIGISEEEKLHLFERFYKADKARDRNKSGSGLGLSIVTKILSLHEASIYVESDEGGTTFEVTLKNNLE